MPTIGLMSLFIDPITLIALGESLDCAQHIMAADQPQQTAIPDHRQSMSTTVDKAFRHLDNVRLGLDGSAEQL